MTGPKLGGPSCARCKTLVNLSAQAVAGADFPFIKERVDTGAMEVRGDPSRQILVFRGVANKRPQLNRTRIRAVAHKLTELRVAS